MTCEKCGREKIDHYQMPTPAQAMESCRCEFEKKSDVDLIKETMEKTKGEFKGIGLWKPLPPTEWPRTIYDSNVLKSEIEKKLTPNQKEQIKVMEKGGIFGMGWYHKPIKASRKFRRQLKKWVKKIKRDKKMIYCHNGYLPTNMECCGCFIPHPKNPLKCVCNECGNEYYRIWIKFIQWLSDLSLTLILRTEKNKLEFEEEKK